MSVASEFLTRGLENIGARLRFSEGLLGIVTALGADAPEICAASAALFSSHHDVGIGVVLGSNVFNLAGLLGLSAVIVGKVDIGREGLLLNGGVALFVAGVVTALVLGLTVPWFSVVLLFVVLIPYVVLLAMHPAQIARLKMPGPVTRFLTAAIGHAHRDTRKRTHTRPARWIDGLVVAASLAVVVLSSIGAVHAAVALAARWNLHHAVMGTLILAALTSIPNLLAAVTLAREGRGAAVVSESLNSNTMNILAGLSLPALIFGMGKASGQALFTVWWMLGMTVFAVVAAGRRRGLNRTGGAILIALYLVFALKIASWK
jgi:cation:H+ antiporter